MIQIRLAEGHDVEAICAIMSDVDLLSPGTRSSKGRGVLVRQLNRVWVVDDDGLVVSIMIFQADFTTPKSYSIPLIATHREKRGMGHALRLIQFAKTQVKKVTGELDGYPENEVSRHLFEKEGFVKVEGRENRQGHQLYRWTAPRAHQ